MHLQPQNSIKYNLDKQSDNSVSQKGFQKFAKKHFGPTFSRKLDNQAVFEFNIGPPWSQSNAQ